MLPPNDASWKGPQTSMCTSSSGLLVLVLDGPRLSLWCLAFTHGSHSASPAALNSFAVGVMPSTSWPVCSLAMLSYPM